MHVASGFSNGPPLPGGAGVGLTLRHPQHFGVAFHGIQGDYFFSGLKFLYIFYLHHPNIDLGRHIYLRYECRLGETLKRGR